MPTCIRRLGGVGVICLLVALAAAIYGSPAPDSGAQPSATPALQVGDWVDSIPQVYLSGYPVLWTPVTTQGITWIPRVQRIERSDHYFAYFSLPTGHMFAASEDDGTLWRIDDGGDYYDNSTWHLADAGTVISVLEWLKAMMRMLAIIVSAALLLFGAVMFLASVWQRIRDWTGSRRNQLDLGAWDGNTTVFTDLWTDPDFRQKVTPYPDLVAAGETLGVFVTP